MIAQEVLHLLIFKVGSNARNDFVFVSMKDIFDMTIWAFIQGLNKTPRKFAQGISPGSIYISSKHGNRSTQMIANFYNNIILPQISTFINFCWKSV
jgi:hypothetical protein